MALGRRREKQTELFISTTELARGPAHPFYTKLNQVLAQAGFDPMVEELCEPYYKSGGRPGIPPGVYFRMLFIGYFEGLGSQRGIAWRCADSLALRDFLGVLVTEATPVHASMTIIRQRLPEAVFDRVFGFVLAQLDQAGLLQGKTLGIDATTLEANAAMKSIVRKDTGADWKDYLRELARAEGIQNPTEEDLRRLDRGRTDKKVSNQQWESRTDPEARITKMKDGRTHLAYKAEHTVDLHTEAIVAAHVTSADRADGETGAESVVLAQANLVAAGRQTEVQEVVADKGYHDNRLLTQCADWSVRTYIPERRQKRRRWTDKPPEFEAAFRANRRRVRGNKGRRLNRWRSERCERSFAHVCETGGGRRTWLRGLENTSKVHTLRCAAYNLGLLLRKVWGLSKPRNGEEALRALILSVLALGMVAAVVVYGDAVERIGWWSVVTVLVVIAIGYCVTAARHLAGAKNSTSLTGC
jgi:transposase